MAIYHLLTLPADRSRQNDQYHFAIVSANSTGDARAIAKDYRSAGLSNTAWDNATVTELIAVLANATNAFSGWTFDIYVQGGANDIAANAVGVLGLVSAVIAAGGTGYSINDVLTVAGGTGTRSATFKVTSVNAGVVDGIALMDAGDYSVVPTGTQATTVSPAGGTGCTLTTFVSSSANLVNLLSHSVTLLNTHIDIAGAALDMSVTPHLLTVAAAGDNLGDLTVVAEMKPPILVNSGGHQVNKRFAIPGLIGTITHQGSAGSALTVEIPDQSTTVVPEVVELGN